MEFAEIIERIQPFAIGGIFVLLYAAEHLYPQRRELVDYRHDAKNFGVGLLNAALIFGVGYFFQQWMEWYAAKDFGLFNLVASPFVLQIVVEGLLLDCAMYWWHRANHRLPMLWRFHRFHHEDEKLNSTSALRFHAVELLLSYAWRLALFPLLGISVGGFALYSIVFSAVVIFHHSGIRIGERLDKALRAVMVTPWMHRVHHSVIRRESDSNYGAVLPWWDRMFGSYRRGDGKPIQFGVDSNKGGK